MALFAHLNDLRHWQGKDRGAMLALLDPSMVFDIIYHDIVLAWVQGLELGSIILCWFTSFV